MSGYLPYTPRNGISLLLLLVLVVMCGVYGLDNGVALTPPMGWMSWERFECNLNCDSDPKNCISERLIKETADAMVEFGFRDAGYKYIAIDDCWSESTRHPDTNELRGNLKRFPSGMKSLIDYVHSKGLKFGIYGDIGEKTCAGYPGSKNFMQKDADTFARWGVDMLKFDGCGGDIDWYEHGYPEMSRYLNHTGRPIVFSCEWPMYESYKGGKPDYARIAKYCNMFRILTDIYDNWSSVKSMIEFFGDNPRNFSSFAKPGAWCDPDQIVIGDYGLSEDQERVQMALWAVMASPLMVSSDLRNIRAESRDILLNAHVIAINQDPLGKEGVVVKTDGQLTYWVKPVLPEGSYAIAILNVHESGGPSHAEFKLADLGISRGDFKLIEVFEQQQLAIISNKRTLTIKVNPMGVQLLKAIPT